MKRKHHRNTKRGRRPNKTNDRRTYNRALRDRLQRGPLMDLIDSLDPFGALLFDEKAHKFSP